LPIAYTAAAAAAAAATPPYNSAGTCRAAAWLRKTPGE